MIKQLKDKVFRANIELVRHGLVRFTWGNVSGFEPNERLMVIKPKGLTYDNLQSDDMVVVDINGNVVEGYLPPSSDTMTHLALYRAFPQLGGIVHTHSFYASGWAEAGMAIPCLSTFHADVFHGDIPCTREMTDEEIDGEYELATGKVLVESIKHGNPLETPGILVRSHGPFTWGKNPEDAVHNAIVLEYVAKTAYLARSINPTVKMNDKLVEAHYARKHNE